MASLPSACLVSLLLLAFFSFPPFILSLSFNYSDLITFRSFLTLKGDVSYGPNSVELSTWNPSIPSHTAGRLYNSDPLHLYDRTTGQFASFNCSFRFQFRNETVYYGDGLAFILVAPASSEVPIDSEGGWLGLVNPTNNGSLDNNIVAVEFDSYYNPIFLDPDANHIGVDVNNIISDATAPKDKLGFDMKSASFVYAWIDYSSSMGKLEVYAVANDTSKPGMPLLSYGINLSAYLPESVLIGFSSSTGTPPPSLEHHRLFSWSFNSTDIGAASAGNKTKLVGGVIAGVLILLLLAAVSVFIIWRKKKRYIFRQNIDEGSDMSGFPSSTYGPRKFTYEELSIATKEFSSTQQLGEGGFGAVYRGILPEDGTEIAVKCISQHSKQGEKEFRAEVTIISRIRHRHLVELKGWCHYKGKLLLVYEYLPNGSLDQYLFAKDKKTLDWGTRYRVVCELGSALRYLHEECEKAVIHRDVKASNIMLDGRYRAKLGDFGLARELMEGSKGHETVIAGTRGYMAPECFKGRATKESDVFSYGAVLLEVATGRRPLDAEGGFLLDWVWGVYGKGGRLMAVIDEKLEGLVEEDELLRVVIVGLACSHPDPNTRPTISHALEILRGHLPLPPIPTSQPLLAAYPPLSTIYTATSSSFPTPTTSPLLYPTHLTKPSKAVASHTYPLGK